MSLSLIADEYNDISLIGMCKNAGKTTVLNYLLQREKKTLGLTSIGLDGESIDLVTKTKKPKIYVKKGDLIATAFKCLEFSTITRQILFSSSINTPLGEVVIVKALSDGFVQLAGPSISTHIKKIKEILFSFNVEKVIIDGALNRKSIASSAIILCTGSAYNLNIETVVNDTYNVCRLYSLERATEKEKDKNYILGALTDSVFKALSKEKKMIVVENASKILLCPDNLQLALRKFKIKVVEQNKLLGVTINPVSPYGYGFNKVEFLNRMSDKLDVAVFNVMSEEN